MKKLDENLKEEIAGLGRVGFDSKGETKRSGSFLVADDVTTESESNEENLVVMPISFAIQVYDWVKDLLFSLFCVYSGMISFVPGLTLFGFFTTLRLAL